MTPTMRFLENNEWLVLEIKYDKKLYILVYNKFSKYQSLLKDESDTYLNTMALHGSELLLRPSEDESIHILSLPAE